MVALVLALSASVCWGVADYLGGIETRRLPGLVVVLISQSIGLAGLIALVSTSGALSPEPSDLTAAAVAGLAGAVGLTAFYHALSIGTMSVVAPITATGAIVPVVIGLGDGDRPSWLQAAGMGAAVVGIILATQAAEEDPESRRLNRASIGLAFIAAVSIGLGLAALDRAADSGALSAVMWARVVSVTALTIVVLSARPSLSGVRSHRRGLVAIGVLDAGATALFTMASTEGLLSVVAVISSLYPVVTVLLAHVLLREQIRSIQVAGIVCALSGMGLVSAG